MTDASGKRFPFASCGEDVTIYGSTNFMGAETTHVGDHVKIDDFVLIDGRGGMTIGSYVHISAFTSIIGRGEIILGDFASISAGCRIVTGTDTFDGSALVGAVVPDDLRKVRRGRVALGRHSALATGVIVHPDVEIGEGCVVASGSVVTKSLPPWTICMGAPAKPIRDRPRGVIDELEAQLRSRGG